MKDEIINALGQILQNNLGNKLTVELANGILVVLSQHVETMLTSKQDADSPPG